MCVVCVSPFCLKKDKEKKEEETIPRGGGRGGKFPYPRWCAPFIDWGEGALGDDDRRRVGSSNTRTVVKDICICMFLRNTIKEKKKKKKEKKKKDYLRPRPNSKKEREREREKHS